MRAIAETPRLLLRELTIADAPAMCRLNADERMMRQLPVPADNSVAAERDRLARYIARAYRVDGFGIWATIWRETEEIIGRCGLRRQTLDDGEHVELTYQIASAWWGRGIATEAAGEIRDFAFSSLGLDRLIALILPDNIASRGVAEKIGMCYLREVTCDGQTFRLYEIEKGAGEQVSR